MIQAQESPCSFIGSLARVLHVIAGGAIPELGLTQGLRRMLSQAWHLARLGSVLSTLVPFTSSCHQSTFFLSSSGGGLPGRLATLTESRRPFYFLRRFTAGSKVLGTWHLAFNGLTRNWPTSKCQMPLAAFNTPTGPASASGH